MSLVLGRLFPIQVHAVKSEVGTLHLKFTRKGQTLCGAVVNGQVDYRLWHPGNIRCSLCIRLSNDWNLREEEVVGSNA
jgi:hypothetical protein